MKGILIVLSAAVLAWLWQKGLLVVQQKIAVAFIGRRGTNHWGAGMTGCTGWTKRVLPLEPGKKYRLYYKTSLSDGDIVVEIIHNKQTVRTFDMHNRTSTLIAEKGRYVIGTRFEKASGEYQLKWEEI